MNYNELGDKLKDLLELERTPVAITWSVEEPENIQKEEGKSTFCTKLNKALNGETFYATSEEEMCMGGAIFTGHQDKCEFPPQMLTLGFLVKMGAYNSIPTAQRSWKHNINLEPEIFKVISFAPLDKAEFEPDVVFIVCNAKQGMEILHANTYDSGEHGIGADSGPICSSMAATPYITGKITYGFGEAGARQNMDINPEEVMVSIPGNDLSRIVSNLEKMRTGVFLKR